MTTSRSVGRFLARRAAAALIALALASAAQLLAPAPSRETGRTVIPIPARATHAAEAGQGPAPLAPDSGPAPIGRIDSQARR